MTKGEEREHPESLVRALLHLRDRISPEEIDRLWIFPVLEWEHRETGVVVVSCFERGDGIRKVHTLEFQAARVRGRVGELPVEILLEEEGVVPAERIPRIIQGVSRRLRENDPGPPEEIVVEGDLEAFGALLPPEPTSPEP